MSIADWWLPDIRAEIEQGDLIKSELQFQLITPIKFIAKGQTGRNQKNTWEESETPVSTTESSPRVIATVNSGYAIVLSYGCELENIKPNNTVLLAPVQPLSNLDASLHAKILGQEVYRYLPIVDIPDIGYGYANLSRTFALQSKLIQPTERIKSMTDDGIFRVQMQLVAYYTRATLPVN